MKIFLSFLQGNPDYPIPAYSFWQYYIKNGITEAGHEWSECEEVDWAFGLVPQSKSDLDLWKSKVWEKTVNYLKKNPADIFLSYLYPHQIDEGSIDSIKKLGIPCINFFCDNIREFKRIPSAFNIFDLNWVPEYKALEMYSKGNFAYLHLPMPMWIEYKYRTPPANDNSRVSFIGSYDIQRQLLLEEILNKSPGISLDIYGRGWLKEEQNKKNVVNKPYGFPDKLKFQFQFLSRFGTMAYLRKVRQQKFMPEFSELLLSSVKGKPTFESYITLTRESLITIGINRYSDFTQPFKRPPSYSRLRDIEAPMLGACYLTEHTSGLDQLYDINLEITTYKNADEFAEQYKKLKQSEDLRMQLRLNAQKRALNDHSIPNSLDKIKKKLFSS